MRFTHYRLRMCATALGVLSLFGSAGVARAQPAAGTSGTLSIPAFTMPLSNYMSPEARRNFQGVLEETAQAPKYNGSIASIEAGRAYFRKFSEADVVRDERLYPVNIQNQTIGGVPTVVVTPKQDVAEAQQHRVLISLHGGAFQWNRGPGSLTYAIPVASVGRIKVISVDYRQGFEHVFPAASEDVAAVYRELLKSYPAKNIGIYGCSAGGILTGEAVAWFIHDKLPVPGAIGMFCGAVVPIGGDSSHLAPLLVGAAPASSSKKPPEMSYFKGTKATDPLVWPGNSPSLLAKFPPTLLITGTRDFTMSSELESEQLLTSAGVDVELHVWDGMWHSFFSNPDMPESKEAYAVMVKFFDKHLSK